jgi:hypothetical protein
MRIIILIVFRFLLKDVWFSREVLWFKIYFCIISSKSCLCQCMACALRGLMVLSGSLLWSNLSPQSGTIDWRWPRYRMACYWSEGAFRRFPALVIGVTYEQSRFMSIDRFSPHRWCLHLIVVVGFECSRDPESYAGGSIASSRVNHVGQVKG